MNKKLFYLALALAGQQARAAEMQLEQSSYDLEGQMQVANARADECCECAPQAPAE